MKDIVPMDHQEAQQAADFIKNKSFIYKEGPSKFTVLSKSGQVKTGFASAQLNP